ncbi:MAG: bifunctional precorrin-2 dehydrogenase/sirohydrochlorin ferrochelatase [Chloroflexi bacterium]|nr:bifunctional precorrin-2 dehydrogenase/sirohydrochlorin ferrochelatase [Chloroflexota bacterium]MDA1147273.1 bifunctional precorrin-2 dehydrogenase/sirohydrochlorin ferrochelatase [Chloroflexota bacterium]
MGYYAVFWEMGDRPVLLVGGGHVADEKVHKLVDAGARVTIVAPALIPAVKQYVDDGRAAWIERPFAPGDTDGYEVVMVATDDGAVNKQVADEARARGIWVNAADDVANCDFILPSLAKRGKIAIATSTGGSSPALARWLRERMEEFLSEDVELLGDLLAEVRVLARQRDRECAGGCELVNTPPPLLCKQCPNRIAADTWQTAIDEPLQNLLRAGDYEGAKRRLIHALGIDQPLKSRATPASAVGSPQETAVAAVAGD